MRGVPTLPDKDSFRKLTENEQRTLVARLNREASLIRRYRGILEVTLKGRIGSANLTQAVLYQAPKQLRVSIAAGALDQVAALITAANGSLSLFEPQEGVLYRGTASRKNVRKVLGLPFLPREFALWLSGRVPLAENLKEKEVSVWASPDEETLLVRWRLPGLGAPWEEFVATAVVERSSKPMRLLLLKLQDRYRGNVHIVSRLSYKDGALEKTEFWLPAIKVSGECRYRTFDINPKGKTFPDAVFRPPPNSVHQFVDLDEVEFEGEAGFFLP